jgi:hypothetical protein
MALPQQDAASTAKSVLSNANKAFPSSMAKTAGSTTGANTPKSTAKSAGSVGGAMGSGIAKAAKAITAGTDAAAQHSGSVADTNRQVGAEEGAKYGMKSMPIMHDGGVVKEDGPHYLQKGETVIPASGRQSEYRKAFEARGAAGKHKYGTGAGSNTTPPAAKEQTRQGGGNEPVKGEKHGEGAEHLEA